MTKIPAILTVLLSAVLGLSALGAPVVPDRELTAIADLSRGDSVALRGEVTRILDEDEFRLRDESGSVRIYIGWKNRVPVEVGETVTVYGIVDDDLVAAFRPEVYASVLVREDGAVVELTR